MDNPRPDLPAFEEIVASLTGKLQGLSTVRSSLVDATEALVRAVYEFEEGKRRVELLTGSAQAMVEEVRRLRPAELAATLEASIASSTRETTEGIHALTERIGSLSLAVTETRSHAVEGLTAIQQQLAAHEAASQEDFSLFGRSMAEVVATAQATLLAAQSDAFQETQRALAALLHEAKLLQERQNALSEAHSRMHDQQTKLAEGQDALLPLISDLGAQQTLLMQQVTAVSDAVGGVRQTSDATLSTVTAVRNMTEAIGPSLESALHSAHNTVMRVLARSTRIQLVSLAAILAAITLVWLTLSGIIPNV
jgi:chromosome segregation ATPase